jgi:hypothetical protein
MEDRLVQVEDEQLTGSAPRVRGDYRVHDANVLAN